MGLLCQPIAVFLSDRAISYASLRGQQESIKATGKFYYPVKADSIYSSVRDCSSGGDHVTAGLRMNAPGPLLCAVI